MEEELRRRSNRIEVMLKIQVIGADTAGQTFMDDAHTVVISPYGAMIVLGRGLTPESEIVVSCLTTKKEAAARVVGQAGASPEGLTTASRAKVTPSVVAWARMRHTGTAPAAKPDAGGNGGTASFADRASERCWV